MKVFWIAIAVAAAAVGCKKKDEPAGPGPGTGTGTGTGGGTAVAATDAAGAGTGSGTGAGPTGGATPVTGGFATPESVLYDPDADVYLVANINGKPADADDNGFISKVSPDIGEVTELKWIDGSAGAVKLDAPKGMAIASGILWVADITVVRKFDAKTGKPKGEVKIPGASFLNDVVADGAGGIYVSDTGVDAKFEGTGTDAVYHVDKAGKVKPLIKNADLGRPNGLHVGEDKTVWVVTFGSGELYAVNPAGEKQAPIKMPKGQLDGIVGLANGEVIVSSWEGEALYRGTPGKGWTELAKNVKAPADLGLDTKRKRVIIPQFNDNQLLLQPL